MVSRDMICDIKDFLVSATFGLFLAHYSLETLWKGDYKNMRKAIFILVIYLNPGSCGYAGQRLSIRERTRRGSWLRKRHYAIPDLNLTVEQKAQITLLRETSLERTSSRFGINCLANAVTWNCSGGIRTPIRRKFWQHRRRSGCWGVKSRTVRRFSDWPFARCWHPNNWIRSRPSSILLTDLPGKNSVLLNISTFHLSRGKRWKNREAAIKARRETWDIRSRR